MMLINPFLLSGGGGGGGGAGKVSFVSSSESGNVVSTTASVVIGSAVKSGDLLLAFVFHRDTLSIPDGWARYASEQAGTSSGVNQFLTVVTKVCAPDDRGSTVQFVQASAGRMAASLSAYSGEKSTPSLIKYAVKNTNSSTLYPSAELTSESEQQVVVAGQCCVISGDGIFYGCPSAYNQITSGSDPSGPSRLCVCYKDATPGIESGSFSNSVGAANDTASVSVLVG